MSPMYVNLYLNKDGSVRRGHYECYSLSEARDHINDGDNYICTIKITTTAATTAVVAT